MTAQEVVDVAKDHKKAGLVGTFCGTLVVALFAAFSDGVTSTSNLAASPNVAARVTALEQRVARDSVRTEQRMTRFEEKQETTLCFAKSIALKTPAAACIK